ncbi:LysR family transcriptional regulator [Methylorubrum extorquens]|uniref:Transcriptional regulator n=2 Tax=Methylorubrum extorquens TaxID=408 RepID=C5B6A4_METEA|nr:LysR family transcriptional regulator [Methylorubrum extorquens]ACS43986.1 Putative transcriptional regulator [Methylorubrum extorquens AM1]EHP95073.1 transcriptional regulator, LysR family [Methylorubrum extorquens DSM 13060]
MLNLQYVETLLAVLATGSFHAAGRRLGLSQPTVSQHVRKLETALRVTLVERDPAGCRPTPQGRALLPHAEALIRAGRRAEEAVAGNRLAIGASGNIGTFLMPEILRRYGDTGAAPADAEISTNTHLLARLEAGEIDVALLEWWEGRSGLVARVWHREPLVVIVDPSHRWARQARVTPQDLTNASLLAGEPGSGTGRVLREALGAVGASFRVDRQLGSTEAVKRAVRAGLGISIVMACSVRDEVGNGVLVALPVEGAELAKSLYAAHRDPLPDTARASGFLHVLTAAVGC